MTSGGGYGDLSHAHYPDEDEDKKPDPNDCPLWCQLGICVTVLGGMILAIVIIEYFTL